MLLGRWLHHRVVFFLLVDLTVHLEGLLVLQLTLSLSSAIGLIAKACADSVVIEMVGLHFLIEHVSLVEVVTEVGDGSLQLSCELDLQPARSLDEGPHP